jgi:hypothetical protein
MAGTSPAMTKKFRVIRNSLEMRSTFSIIRNQPRFPVKFSDIFIGNFSVTLTAPPHLLRERFEFERGCFLLRQIMQTKREQGHRTVNERLRKALYSRA